MEIAPPKEPKPFKQPKPLRWKLAKGERADLRSPFGIIGVTNKSLQNPNVIATIAEIEKQTGRKIFGVVVVRDE